jgi:hypothetical protein
MSSYAQDLDPEFPKFVARCRCEWAASDYGEDARSRVLSIANAHAERDRHTCDVTVLRVGEDGSEEVIR